MRQNLAQLLGKRLLLSLGDFQPRQFGDLLDFLLRDFHNYHSLRMFKMVAFSPTRPGAPKRTPLPRKAAGCQATEAYLFSPTRPELPRQLFHRRVRRRKMDDRERSWRPFSTSDYSTVTLFARFLG